LKAECPALYYGNFVRLMKFCGVKIEYWDITTVGLAIVADLVMLNEGHRFIRKKAVYIVSVATRVRQNSFRRKRKLLEGGKEKRHFMMRNS
jgi:hypothetical protein